MDKGKNVLLIGASGGVGKRLSLDLAKAGHTLMLHGKADSEALDALATEIKSQYGVAYTHRCDITVEAEVQELVAAAVEKMGSVDVLINNAGITRSAMTWKTSADDWADTLAVNLTGPFYTTKHVLPSMRSKGWGRIINITSVVAQTGQAGTSAYAASKAGLIGLTKSVAKETATKGITVNALALGYFDAGMLYTIPEEMRDGIRTTIPKQEFGDTETISETINFLCGDAAAYITGQTLNLNGGLY